MADNLNLNIRMNSGQAERNTRRLEQAFRESNKSVLQATSGMKKYTDSSVVGLSKVQNKVRSVSIDIANMNRSVINSFNRSNAIVQKGVIGIQNFGYSTKKYLTDSASSVNKFKNSLSLVNNSLHKIVGGTRTFSSSPKTHIGSVINQWDRYKRQQNDIINVLRRQGTAFDSVKNKLLSLRGSLAPLGGHFQNAFSGALNTMRSVFRLTGYISMALGGMTLGRVSRDTLDFESMVGLLNSTLRATKPTVDELKNSLVGISVATATGTTELARAYTQLISNPMFDPKRGGAVEGSEEYRRNMKLNEEIMLSAAKTAQGTNADFFDMTISFQDFAGGFGVQLKSIEDVNNVFGTFVEMLHVSKGEMKDLSGEFGKFAKTTQMAGVPTHESVASFAAFSLQGFTPFQAGTRALALGRYMQRTENHIQRLQSKFADSSALKDFDFTSIFYTEKDGEIMKRSLQDTMKEIDKILNDETLDARTKSLLGATLFPEIRQQQAVLSLIDAMKNPEAGLGEQISRILSVEEIGGLDFVEKEFAYKMNNIGDAWNILTNSIKEMSQALASGTLHIMADLFTGSNVTDATHFADRFYTIKSTLEGTMPALVPLVDKFEQLFTWLNTDMGRQSLVNLGKSLINLGKFLENILKTFLNIISNPMVQSFMSLLAENPVSGILISLTGLNLMKQAIIGGFTVGGSLIASALTGTAPAVGTVIGTGVLTSLLPVLGKLGLGAAIVGGAYVGGKKWSESTTSGETSLINRAGEIARDFGLEYNKLHSQRSFEDLQKQASLPYQLFSKGTFGSTFKGVATALRDLGADTLGMFYGQDLTARSGQVIGDLLHKETTSVSEKGGFFKPEYLDKIQKARQLQMSSQEISKIYESMGRTILPAEMFRYLSNTDAGSFFRFAETGKGDVYAGGVALTEEQRNKLLEAWVDLPLDIRDNLVNKWNLQSTGVGDTSGIDEIISKQLSDKGFIESDKVDEYKQLEAIQTNIEESAEKISKYFDDREANDISLFEHISNIVTEKLNQPMSLYSSVHINGQVFQSQGMASPGRSADKANWGSN